MSLLLLTFKKVTTRPSFLSKEAEKHSAKCKTTHEAQSHDIVRDSFNRPPRDGPAAPFQENPDTGRAKYASAYVCPPGSDFSLSKEIKERNAEQNHAKIAGQAVKNKRSSQALGDLSRAFHRPQAKGVDAENQCRPDQRRNEARGAPTTYRDACVT